MRLWGVCCWLAARKAGRMILFAVLAFWIGLVVAVAASMRLFG